MKAAALLTLLLLTAGCATKSTLPATSHDKGDLPILQGYVLDSALHPLTGANVTITSANATTQTDAHGHYGFAILPGAEALVAVAQAAGFQPMGKSVQLSVGNSTMLNFTLNAVPTLKPYVEKQSFKGFLSCQASVTTTGDRQIDCGGSQNVNIWDFNVGPNVAGVVLETFWTAKTPLANFLNATVETVGRGGQDAQLSTVQGGPVLRAAVTNDECAKYYPQGGTLRITLSAATNAADQEQAAGAALVVEQDFQVIASIFYVAPPDPTYSAANPS